MSVGLNWEDKSTQTTRTYNIQHHLNCQVLRTFAQSSRHGIINDWLR